jgi:polyisoprenoid-binding protein YceI
MARLTAPGSSNGISIAPHQGDVLAPTTGTTGTTWQIDPAASRVGFAIGKRLLFVKKLTVTGHFADIRGTIWLDAQEPATAQATVAIGAASIDTRQARRDAHLRSAGFFDAERHPTLMFTSRRIITLDRAAGHYQVTGDLTIRGVTREVQLAAYYRAAEPGTPAPRIELSGSLNRRDFGLDWNSPLIKIADAVTVTLDVQAVQHA